MTRPNPHDVPPFYQGYVEHVKDLDVLEALSFSIGQTVELFRSVPEDKGEFRYAPEKWSIKEVLCHMMDAERIFAYRALRFARKDKTPLHGFEENDYAPEANAHARSVASLIVEMQNLRTTSLDLYKSFTPEMLSRIGTANNVQMSVLTLGYVIAGHESHHRKVLRERYLK